MKNELAIFENRPIRSVEHEGEMYFSIVDVIGVLTDATQPRTYWAKLKKQEPQLVMNCTLLKLQSTDGKYYETDCSNTEGIFIIIMSVPSPKAQKIRLWIAQAGKEKLEKLGEQMTISTLIFSHTKHNEKSIGLSKFKTYLMHDTLRGFYKIGKSTSPKIREKTLQAEIPSIELLHVVYSDVELFFHEKFSSKRLRGEWFSLSESDVSYIKTH